MNKGPIERLVDNHYSTIKSMEIAKDAVKSKTKEVKAAEILAKLELLLPSIEDLIKRQILKGYSNADQTSIMRIGHNLMLDSVSTATDHVRYYEGAPFNKEVLEYFEHCIEKGRETLQNIGRSWRWNAFGWDSAYKGFARDANLFDEAVQRKNAELSKPSEVEAKPSTSAPKADGEGIAMVDPDIIVMVDPDIFDEPEKAATSQATEEYSTKSETLSQKILRETFKKANQRLLDLEAKELAAQKTAETDANETSGYYCSFEDRAFRDMAVSQSEAKAYKHGQNALKLRQQRDTLEREFKEKHAGLPQKEAQERLERERAQREAQERLEREKAQQEEQARLERERAQREAQERLEREKAQREAQARLERERAQREAQERLERERAQREAQARLERERAQREAQERLERERAKQEAQARLERERAKQEAQARLERERAKQEAQARLERERAKQEAQARRINAEPLDQVYSRTHSVDSVIQQAEAQNIPHLDIYNVITFIRSAEVTSRATLAMKVQEAQSKVAEYNNRHKI